MSINKNSEPEAIKNWQIFLIGQGIAVQRTMEWDKQTIAATKEFQTREKLKVDGKPSDKTLGLVLDKQIEQAKLKAELNETEE